MPKVVVPILNTEYSVVVVWGKEWFVRQVIKDYEHDDVDLLYGRVRGQHFHTSGRHELIYLSRPPSDPEMIGTLAHEACHSVESILDTIGQSVSGEILAHSVGAVVREVLKQR